MISERTNHPPSARDDSPEYRVWRDAQMSIWTETDFSDLLHGPEGYFGGSAE